MRRISVLMCFMVGLGTAGLACDSDSDSSGEASGTHTESGDEAMAEEGESPVGAEGAEDPEEGGDEPEGELEDPEGEPEDPEGEPEDPEGEPEDPEGEPEDPEEEGGAAPEGPCLETSTDFLSLYSAAVGSETTGEVALYNCGAELVLGEAWFTGPNVDEFAIGNADELAGWTLAPGESVVIEIVHTELNEEFDLVTLVVENDSGDYGVEVSVGAQPGALCESEIYSADGAFGAIAMMGVERVYVVGDTNYGSAFRLGQLNLSDGSFDEVIPVAEQDFAVMTAEWISVEGTAVSAYQFYPQSLLWTYDESTAETTSVAPEVDPVHGPSTYEYGGETYRVHIGQQEDSCGNVCIVRDTPVAGAFEEVLDDSELPYTVHSGTVFFFSGHAYFQSYQSSAEELGSDVLRRVPLGGGDVEVVYEFPSGQVNSGIHSAVPAPDGSLYWLHYEQKDLESEWVATIDQYQPSTNELSVGVVTGLSRGESNLSLLGDTLVWRDEAGLHQAPAEGGLFDTFYAASPGTQPERIFYTPSGNRIYFAVSTTTEDGTSSAFIGCALLD